LIALIIGYRITNGKAAACCPAAFGDVPHRIDASRPKRFRRFAALSTSSAGERDATIAFTRVQLRIYGSEGLNGAATNK